ncbi:hypothetical protein [Paraherbaspirillum soli]|uniref:Type 1 fimbrial protein n=1 Tax=Paraherbaspirillum soli TaxID=631222 RepID=A0ABW0MBT3_9BURK
MKLISVQLAAASTLLCLASSVTAGGSSGVIHFTGALVEPPCEFNTASDATPSPATLQLDLHCPERTAFDVSFQRVGRPAASAAAAASNISFSRDGKPLGPAAAASYAMAFQGTSRLALEANQIGSRAAASGPVPVLMTITYQ